jgi:UDP-N-acetylmuramate--alanine ligase
MIDLAYIKHIHFIGISGISMRGLSKYTQEKYSHITVTGNTDLNNFYINDFIEINKQIEDFINNINICVYTASINQEHEEIKKIKEFNKKNNNKIILLNRVEYLNLITEDGERICVLGAHGKTSITTYLMQMLDCLKPTTFVGGVINEKGDTYKTFSIRNNHKLYIVENDESQPTFINLNSEYTILPNISNDHLENYNNSFEEYISVFKNYFNTVKNKNKCIIYNKNIHNNKDSNNFYEILNNLVIDSNLNNISYGYENSHVNIKIIENPHDPKILKWQLITEHMNLLELNNKIFTVDMIGSWNIYNITGSIIMATLKGISINENLKLFKPARRLEVIYKKNHKIIFDDYGVHPYEIKNVLENLKKIYNSIIIIWEPHRLTRLKQFQKEFKEIFFHENMYFISLYEVTHIKTNEFFKYIDYGKYIKDENQLKDILLMDNHKVIILFTAGNLSYTVKKILL